jgi:hypothetical protein
VDRGKAGVKRSVAVDGRGIPLGCVTAPASRHDSPLLVPTLDAAGALGLAPGGATVHLDRGYDSKLTRERLLGLGLLAEISEKGRPAPLNATRRWVVERTTPGRTPTRSWCGAPRGGGEWWTSGWASRTWSSSSGGWFERAGAATAGRDDPLNDRDLLAEPLRQKAYRSGYLPALRITATPPGWTRKLILSTNSAMRLPDRWKMPRYRYQRVHPSRTRTLRAYCACSGDRGCPGPRRVHPTTGSSQAVSPTPRTFSTPSQIRPAG